MKLSKEQQERVIHELDSPWGRVTLRCDGYLVTLLMQRASKGALTFRVITYINGRMSAAWCLERNAAPESRFLRKSVRPNLTPAKRKAAEKALGKRYVAKDPFYSGSYTVFLPDWANGKAAINHLCKVCECVELLTREEGHAALAALERVTHGERSDAELTLVG